MKTDIWFVPEWAISRTDHLKLGTVAQKNFRKKAHHAHLSVAKKKSICSSLWRQFLRYCFHTKCSHQSHFCEHVCCCFYTHCDHHIRTHLCVCMHLHFYWSNVLIRKLQSSATSEGPQEWHTHTHTFWFCLVVLFASSQAWTCPSFCMINKKAIKTNNSSPYSHYWKSSLGPVILQQLQLEKMIYRNSAMTLSDHIPKNGMPSNGTWHLMTEPWHFIPRLAAAAKYHSLLRNLTQCMGNWRKMFSMQVCKGSRHSNLLLHSQQLNIPVQTSPSAGTTNYRAASTWKGLKKLARLEFQL